MLQFRRNNRILAENTKNFPKTERLLSNSDYQNALKRGEKLHTKYLITFTVRNKFEFSRVGIIVSKRIKRAVIRNKWKRCIREIYRNNKKSFQKNCDIVFAVKEAAKNVKKDDVFEAVKSSLLKD